MDEEVIRAQISMHDASTMGVDKAFDGLPKQLFPKRERDHIVLAIEIVLETAMAGFSKYQSRRKLRLPAKAP